MRVVCRPSVGAPAVARVGAAVLAAVLAAALAGQRAAIPVRVPDWIAAGPMLGHVGSSRVRIWLRVRKGVEFVARGTLQGPDGLRAAVAKIARLGDQVRLVELEGLPADTGLVVQLCEGEHFNRGVGLRLRTAPAPAATGRVRIAFGSGCNDALYPEVPVLTAAAREQPDLFVFAGDSTFYVREIRGEASAAQPQPPLLRVETSGGDGDWSKEKRMLARQLRTRRNPWLQVLLRSVPCYAVWDDHDFGDQGADRTFDGRKDSLQVFRRMWANPDFGIPGTKGCFSSFRRGPVEVFLMDGRYHRRVRDGKHPDLPPKDGTIWGREQLAWLCGGLRRSTAPVKLIVSGSPILQGGGAPDSHQQLAPREHQELRACLDAAKITGVVFLSGDRGRSELRTQRLGGRMLLEFTASPLTGGGRLARGDGERRPGTEWTVRGDCYGLVTVDIPAAGEGTITCEVRDAGNQVPRIAGRLYRSSWPLSALR